MFYTNQLVQLPLIIAILSLLVLSNAQIPDSLGYILPTSGFASTTQFMVGPELGPGTACGAVGWANGVKAGSPPAGGGPGFLYAAINQLGFGANPLGANAGGPGAACGICYKLTPVSASGEALTQQAMTFMIIDECPVSPIPINNNNCGMCKTGDKNIFNQEWHFDIAVDAMNQSQYDLFFKGVTYGSNWLSVQFQETSCSSHTNPDPPIADWGCIGADCPNNHAAPVCQGVSNTHTLQDGVTIVTT